MSQIIDGKLVSKQVRQRVKEETEKLKAKGITPGLAVIIVGDDPASQVYVKNKEKACDEVGFYSEKYALSENTTQEELNNLVKELNNKKEISGILCQLPLPKHLDDKEVINLIDPIKDVDAFHPVNVGAIMIGDYNFLPCTPAGVMELIHSTSLWQCSFSTKMQLLKLLIQKLLTLKKLPKVQISLLPLSVNRNL